jgi:hypothetical protein
MSDIQYRPGTIEDSYTVFCLFEETISDEFQRFGMEATSWPDAEALARMWQRRASLYHHLARTAEQFWIAEDDGRAIGFARSILHDDVRQLTEFFVLPGNQSGGVGRELLARAFPSDGTRRRAIIATVDTRAQARYLKTGVYPRFPLYYFYRQPEATELESDLTIEPLPSSPTAAILTTLGDIDQAVLEFRREEDHAWLLTDRHGYLYRRNGRAVGYGYMGKGNGPFALLDPADFPAVLAHAETQAAATASGHFGLEVPMLNRAAVDHLLGRGFQMHGFIALVMSDVPFGRFENYLVLSPPFTF